MLDKNKLDIIYEHACIAKYQMEKFYGPSLPKSYCDLSDALEWYWNNIYLRPRSFIEGNPATSTVELT